MLNLLINLMSHDSNRISTIQNTIKITSFTFSGNLRIPIPSLEK